MHQSYPDIIAAITEGIRRGHSYDGDPYSITSDCQTPLTDVGGSRCGCVATPKWWDENGVPRFADHHPSHCPDIYADEVALVQISCQGCGREFPVQMSWSMSDAVRELMRVGRHSLFEKLLTRVVDALASIALGEPIATVIASVKGERDVATAYVPSTLAAQVRAGTIHYGDPPHTDCCAAGPTMNCWDLRVVEFWARGFALRHIREPENKSPTMAVAECNDWTRVPELEVQLPDATNAERLERV